MRANVAERGTTTHEQQVVLGKEREREGRRDAKEKKKRESERERRSGLNVGWLWRGLVIASLKQKRNKKFVGSYKNRMIVTQNKYIRSFIQQKHDFDVKLSYNNNNNSS